ncbi:hypothetical protein NM688_g2611 [Phlebia brevispora]|uniref:Uncharacterized protein n=1 Tax=Phlebia brevispora TaxID=194682 RepID=A0ACC1T8S7_9APHY|nr:hypothetical protein NM688_g2611 [Phlebia brevispora]
MKLISSCAVLLSLTASALAASNLTLLKEYSGSSFFDDWDFYGDSNVNYLGEPWNGTTPWDDFTSGDVFYMGRSNGSKLYTVESNGHAYITVDNTSFVAPGQKRPSIRLTSKDWYNYGTVWVIDVYHLPWGCSVWPSIWTSGSVWPQDGEIDIIEGVNRMTYNRMALHTTSGCSAANGTDQDGTPGTPDCSQAAGCTVDENKPNSYGPDFNSNSGGVWGAQFDVSGIYIWFWPRTEIPPSISTSNGSIDLIDWGTPSAAYPSSSCNITNYFGWQQLIIDITLCGQWAGQDSIYDQTCNNTAQIPANSPSSRCTTDNVFNNGTADYAMAYFEIGSIKAFAANTTAISSTTPSSLVPGATASNTGGSSPASTSSSLPSGSNTQGSTGGGPLVVSDQLQKFAMLFAVLTWLLLL